MLRLNLLCAVHVRSGFARLHTTQTSSSGARVTFSYRNSRRYLPHLPYEISNIIRLINFAAADAVEPLYGLSKYSRSVWFVASLE